MEYVIKPNNLWIKVKCVNKGLIPNKNLSLYGCKRSPLKCLDAYNTMELTASQEKIFEWRLFFLAVLQCIENIL